MRKKIIIGCFILCIGVSVFVLIRNGIKNDEGHMNYSANNIETKEKKIRMSSPIQKIDSIASTNSLKAQLNNSSNIKIIHHNHKDKSHYYDKEVVVAFKSRPDKAGLNKVLLDINGAVKEKLDSTYIFKSTSKTTDELLHYFQQNSNVSFSEPHYIYLKNEVNDTYYLPYQWNLPAIATEDAWTINRGSKNIKIAVVDTGVDLHHPDLVNRLDKGYNAIDDTDNPDDDNGHGTHVAGIIAADTNNGEGVAGITWYNPIIPIKALGADGSGGSLAIAKGIIWATDHGAEVINLSLGNYQGSELMKKAIKYAQDKNVVIISAAGNDNTNQPSFPAAYPGVIGVAAVDAHGNRAAFSNYGDYIDVAAPGVDIPSTYFQGQYAALSGTSMAAPHVTALAALIRSVKPDLKNTEVADIITRTTQKTGQPMPDPYYGNGIIDNVKALQYSSQR
jgi:thermitase